VHKSETLDTEKGNLVLDTRTESDSLFGATEKRDVDPLEYAFQILRSWLHLIALVVIFSVGIALGFSLFQTPAYEASTEMLVERRYADESSLGLSGEVQGLQQSTLTMVELVNSRPVADAVVRELDLQISSESLLARLSAEQVNATQVISVTYEDPRPERAQQVVNAIGDEFSEQASEAFAAQGITVTVWEAAILPEEPVSPDTIRNIGLGLFAGVMLGLGLAFLLELLHTRKTKRYELAGEDK
jgi:receptor protein-tyrosine kinase